MWTWVAIDAESKLIPTWRIGPRDAITAHAFMTDLADRLKHRVQLTTDGLQSYVEAVEDAFGMDIDYAMLIKVYGADSESERRYSPVVCQSCTVRPVQGDEGWRHGAAVEHPRHRWAAGRARSAGGSVSPPPDHFEHLTPDEEWEARYRLSRDDSQRRNQDDHPPHNGDGGGGGCLGVILLALACLIWLFAQT